MTICGHFEMPELNGETWKSQNCEECHLFRNLKVFFEGVKHNAYNEGKILVVEIMLYVRTVTTAYHNCIS